MSGHIHTDVASLAFTAVGVFLFAHAMRMIGAYIANKGAKTAGTALGAYFTLGGK